jgi:hypothetical protein
VTGRNFAREHALYKQEREQKRQAEVSRKIVIFAGVIGEYPECPNAVKPDKK